MHYRIFWDWTGADRGEYNMLFERVLGDVCEGGDAVVRRGHQIYSKEKCESVK